MKKMGVLINECQNNSEIGWNHMGDLSLAEEMICAAKKSIADIAKFQYWNPDYLKPGSWDSDGRRDL